ACLALPVECVDIVPFERVCRRCVTLQHRSKNTPANSGSDVVLIWERQHWNIMTVCEIRTHPAGQYAGLERFLGCIEVSNGWPYRYFATDDFQHISRHIEI